MAKRKPDTGAIYISPRLRASLEPVGRCALTVVTAPMGYGKTTAVNWFLGTQPPGCAIRISIYSDSLPALWQSGRRAFRDAGLTALEGFECPGDPASAGLLADTLCRELRRQEPWYVFLDDLHLMPDRRVARFLCELAARLPDNVHLIAASRDKALSGDRCCGWAGVCTASGPGSCGWRAMSWRPMPTGSARPWTGSSWRSCSRPRGVDGRRVSAFAGSGGPGDRPGGDGGHL